MNNQSLLKYVVLITAIIQQISPVFSNLNNDNYRRASNDPIILPAGYAFVVWGVITLLALVYAIYQVLINRKNAALHQQIAPKLIIVYTLFSIWLFAASKNWLPVTVIVFVVMFYFLIKIFKEVLQHKKELTAGEKIFLLGQIAIYSGWTTVAIFANTASMITFYGVTDLGNIGVSWQTIILLSALYNALYFIKKLDRNPVYICTILWAFVGVFFGIIANKNVEILSVVSVSAIITVIIFGFLPSKFLPNFYKNQ